MKVSAGYDRKCCIVWWRHESPGRRGDRDVVLRDDEEEEWDVSWLGGYIKSGGPADTPSDPHSTFTIPSHSLPDKVPSPIFFVSFSRMFFLFRDFRIWIWVKSELVDFQICCQVYLFEGSKVLSIVIGIYESKKKMIFGWYFKFLECVILTWSVTKYLHEKFLNLLDDFWFYFISTYKTYESCGFVHVFLSHQMSKFHEIWLKA